MTAGEKIDALLKYLNINAKVFSEKLGYQRPQIIYDIQKGKTKAISIDVAEKIISVFPEIQKSWLLADEGEMIKGVQADRAVDKFAMPVGEYREDEIPERFMSRLVPMSAMGGSLVGFEEDGVRREDCERVISPVAGADWAVPVCGDSMEPEYPNGSRVFVKQIDPEDFIQWGNVFVLDTTNGLIIKTVVQSDKEGCIKCVSLNPSGRYQPFDVPMRTVRAMYRVLLCVSVK